jgi:hypothetical protein
VKGQLPRVEDFSVAKIEACEEVFPVFLPLLPDVFRFDGVFLERFFFDGLGRNTGRGATLATTLQTLTKVKRPVGNDKAIKCLVFTLENRAGDAGTKRGDRRTPRRLGVASGTAESGSQTAFGPFQVVRDGGKCGSLGDVPLGGELQLAIFWELKILLKVVVSAEDSADGFLGSRGRDEGKRLRGLASLRHLDCGPAVSKEVVVIIRVSEPI